MQIWGSHSSNMPSLKLAESRLRAHRNLALTSRSLRTYSVQAQKLLENIKLPHDPLTKHIDNLAGLFDLLVADYQKLFNNVSSQPLQMDVADIELNFNSKDLKPYMEPSDG